MFLFNSSRIVRSQSRGSAREFLLYGARTPGQSYVKRADKVQSVASRPKKLLASWRVKRVWASSERYRDHRHVSTRVHFEAKSASIDFNANEPTKFAGGVYCEQLNVAETLLPGTTNCSKVSSLATKVACSLLGRAILARVCRVTTEASRSVR